MNKKSKTTSQNSSFFNFLFEKKQKKRLALMGLFYLIGYIALIYMYPYVDGISDTGGYIQSAAQNKYLGYRPFGYSKFLNILHGISTSMSCIVFVQYWLSAISTVIFVFTIKYFYQPKNNIVELFFEIFSICSITVIYLTNCVLSDSLFTSLTVLWIVTGIWFINAPKMSSKTMLFVAHLILLAFIFAVRFTGLFYIAITILIVAITLFKQKKVIAITFISSAALLFVLLYRGQINSTYELTRIKTFSAFSGWQMANNALHVMPYVDIDTNKITNREVREFTVFALTYKDKIRESVEHTPHYSTATFIWDKNMPLKQFLFIKIRQKNMEYLRTFTYLGENVYSKFAGEMMKQHPVAYFMHYILPNTLSVLYPNHDDVFVKYTGDIPGELLKNWFQMDEKTSLHSNSNFVANTSVFLSLFQLITWLLIFAAVVFHLIKKQYKQWNPIQNKIYWSLVFFVLSYLAFYIYASPFATRYICPIHVLQIAIIYLGINSFEYKKQLDEDVTPSSL